MGLQGFDETYYLSEKLAALQAQYPEWNGKDTQFLKNTLYSVYGLTPEAHYTQYGYAEGLSPNEFFDPDEYRFAKAADLVEKGLYRSMESALAAFDTAWQGDVYEHYLRYGAAEGINPSNNFDETQYLSDKLQALLQDATSRDEWTGKTIDDLRDYFSTIGLTVLGHYVSYGQAESLSPSEVPADQQVDPTDTPWVLPHDDVQIPDALDLTWVDTTQIASSPNDAIGMVTVTMGSTISFGTGFLISPEYVLTNAHVILDDTGQVLPDAQVTFLPGLNGELSNTAKKYDASTVWLETTFDASLYPDWPDNDLALLKLDTPVELSGGYITLEPDPEISISESVISAGYPIEGISQDDPTTPKPDYFQWEVSGTIDTLLFDGSVLGLSQSMTVTAGASGSPVFYTQGTTTYLEGVLAGKSGESIVAAAMDQDSYNWILGILQQDGYYADYSLI